MLNWLLSSNNSDEEKEDEEKNRFDHQNHNSSPTNELTYQQHKILRHPPSSQPLKKKNYDFMKVILYDNFNATTTLNLDKDDTAEMVFRKPCFFTLI